MNQANRALLLMMVCADSFQLQQAMRKSPKPEMVGDKFTGRIAHTFTQNEFIIHFEDHDKIVQITEI